MAKPHAKTKQPMSKGEWSVLFLHHPVLRYCTHQWKIILEIMLQLYKLLIKKKIHHLVFSQVADFPPRKLPSRHS